MVDDTLNPLQLINMKPYVNKLERIRIGREV